MKKSKGLLISAVAALSFSPLLTGCNLFNKDPIDDNEDSFSFSIALASGKNELEVGAQGEKIVLMGEGVNDEGREYVYTSSNPGVAEINSHGNITVKAPGQVNFQVKETTSGYTATLVSPITVVAAAVPFTGARNYAAQGGADAIKTRTDILGKLEKYVMDSHLTGITLFDNGGYVKYAPRIDLPTTNYITGYGFGLLREGSITGPMATEPNEKYKEYYHTGISDDPGEIDAHNNSGSLVSDMYSYISQSYWGTKMNKNKTGYDWYPVLAKDKVIKPSVDKNGNISWASTATDFNRPIPMDKKNDLGLYKKWRIYVKTGASDGVKYRHNGIHSEYENRGIALADYEAIYQALLTGSSGMSRGTEMAFDESYGIKGAANYYTATLDLKNIEAIDNAWNSMKADGSLGINTGTDEKGQEYIELELVNPIDEFTAMYTLSSNLVSPIPRSFLDLIGDGSFIQGMQKYGKFNGGDDMNSFIVNVGPYMLEDWGKEQYIVFSRNDDWFEVKDGAYKIKGIHNRYIDSSTDLEANYAQFNSGMIDVCGIPTDKINYEKNQPRVYTTKGDSTFKLNVNSCTEAQWKEYFGPNGTISPNSNWKVKQWMSNANFLNGLFYSINRKEFATKRGVQPSINYFSDAYLSNPETGESYNETQQHKDAVEAYHTVVNGEDNYGYDLGKAVNSFKLAIEELSKQGFAKGTVSNPKTIDIEIVWMNPTDTKEYGEDIKAYFEAAFNDPAVCGGTVVLDVKNIDGTLDYQDVYDKMGRGEFDLGFGAISGNTYNPLNFLEVLKSDNSSSFTLNWGADTSKVDPVYPIIYEGAKWSFDALWEVADHGGVVEDGVKVKPVKECYTMKTYDLGGKETSILYNGFNVDIPCSFVDVSNVEFNVSGVKVYSQGKGYTEVPFTKSGDVLKVTVPADKAAEINNSLKYQFKDDTDITQNPWKLNPFIADKNGSLWYFVVDYTMTIGGGMPGETSIIVAPSKLSEN